MAAPLAYQPPPLMDLRRLAPADLEALLEEEIRTWNAQLHWDFSASANLVRRFVGMRALSGYAMLERDRAIGYAYYVVEDHKGLVGDLFLLEAYRTVENEDRLLGEVVSAISRQHRVRRIESQLMMLLPAVNRVLPPGMAPRAFPRQFMAMSLAPQANRMPRPPRQPRIGIEPWQDKFQEAAARLIAAAYRDHIDSSINDQYQTPGGAVRFLHNIVQYPGCGTFFGPASVVARETGGRIVGMCLASLVGPGAGHITQICVHPSHRGRGLGRDLLEYSLAALAAEGCQDVSLTVTSSNESAILLYQHVGFRTLRRFPAFVWHLES